MKVEILENHHFGLNILLVKCFPFKVQLWWSKRDTASCIAPRFYALEDRIMMLMTNNFASLNVEIRRLKFFVGLLYRPRNKNIKEY